MRKNFFKVALRNLLILGGIVLFAGLLSGLFPALFISGFQPASSLKGTKLLSKDFMLLVLIGNVIAWPLAWYAVNKWLQEFTYKINIRWQVFVVSAIVTLVIALLTISFRCIKTARTNPVKSLRAE